MHFDFSFTLGNVVTIGALGFVAKILWRMDSSMRKFFVEHEMLIIDYCKREGIEARNLPTRARV